MSIACVANQNRPFCDSVVLLAVICALVDCVDEVNASADRIPFDNLVAHGGQRGGVTFGLKEATRE